MLENIRTGDVIVIADLTTNSVAFKDYLDIYGITTDDWLLVKLPIASSMGIVVVTTEMLN